MGRARSGIAGDAPPQRIGCDDEREDPDEFCGPLSAPTSTTEVEANAFCDNGARQAVPEPGVVDDTEPLKFGAVKAAPPTKARTRGVLLYALSSFFLSTMVSLAKLLEHGTSESAATLPVLEVVLVRSCIVMSCALGGLAIDRVSPLGAPPCQPLLLLRGLLGAGGVIFMFWSASLLPLVELVVLTFTMPLWGAFFSRLFLGEGMSRAFALVMPLCAAGVLLIARPWQVASEAEKSRFPLQRLGVTVALSQAALSAGAKTCVRALGKSGQHPHVILTYLSLFGVGFSAAGLFGFQSREVLAPKPWQWAVLCLAGLCGFGSQTTSTFALRHISVGEGAIVNYLNIVWSMLYSWLAFDELPATSSVAGGALIVLCTFTMLLMSR